MRWAVDGAVTVLGEPAGADYAVVFDIDEEGTAVGAAEIDGRTVTVPVAWSGDQPTSLAERLSCGVHAAVFSVASNGRLGGAITDDVTASEFEALVWDPARPGTLAGILDRLTGPAGCTIAPPGDGQGGLAAQVSVMFDFRLGE